MLNDPLEFLVTNTDAYYYRTGGNGQAVVSVAVFDKSGVADALAVLQKQYPQNIQEPDAHASVAAPTASKRATTRDDEPLVAPKQWQRVQAVEPPAPTFEVILTGDLATRFMQEQHNYTQQYGTPPTASARTR